MKDAGGELVALLGGSIFLGIILFYYVGTSTILTAGFSGAGNLVKSYSSLLAKSYPTVPAGG